jgi:hypothetical protein
MKNIRHWTSKEIAQLKQVNNENNGDVIKTGKQLCTVLNRTEKAVCEKLYRINKLSGKIRVVKEKIEVSKRPFKFWTNAETQAVITSIEKFKSVSKAVKWLATKINRSENNIYNKAKELSKKGLLILPAKVTKTKSYVKKANRTEAKIDVKPVDLPKGFNFTFNPSKAEMYNDRVVLFF